MLTARHVVVFPERDETKAIVLEWPDLKDASGKIYSAEATEIISDFDTDCDIAILRCRIPPQAHVSSLLLAHRFPVEHEKWAGFGYPQIGKDEDTGTRTKISVLGIFHPPDAVSHKISLTSESEALEKSGWRGVSGAPVFQVTTLYAVITATPTNRQECFSAVSIPYLLKHDQKFREVVGIEELDTNFSKAIAHLQAAPESCKALFAEISKIEKAVADAPDSIIRYLVKLPIPELLRVVQESQQLFNKKNIHNELAELVRMLLPSLYGFDCVSSIRSCKGDAAVSILQIPYATDISAEILMASADKRPAEFRVISLETRKDIRPGKFRLSLPPESGPDSGMQQLQDVHDDLYNRLVGGQGIENIRLAIDEHLFAKIPSKQSRVYSLEEKQILTQRALQREASVFRPGYYWLWSIPPEAQETEKDKMVELAKKLKAAYPHITFLSLEYDVFK